MTAGARSRRRRSRVPPLPRDTAATAFTVLLADLISRIPGARAAALVDRDGESVDYAGTLSPFDVKVAAAHWQIILAELARTALLAGPRHMVVRGRMRSFVIRVLADGYAVVLVLAARAGFLPSPRAFEVFERGLRVEAGIGASHGGPTWTPVLVEQDARARPYAISATPDAPVENLEVLGAVMGLRRGERGFRVRFGSGFETTIVREPGGTWYADEPIGQSDPTGRSRAK